MVYKKCKNCKKSINLIKEKYVLLGTYNGTGKAKKDEQYFHFECWRIYFKDSVTAKIKGSIQKTTQNLSKIIKDQDLRMKNKFNAI